MGITDNPYWIAGRVNAASQQGVICQYGLNPDQNCSNCFSSLLNIISSKFSGDPLRSTVFAGNSSIHCHGIFYNTIGAFRCDIVEKNRIDGIAFFSQEIRIYGNSSITKLLNALSGNQWIWVTRANINGFNPALYDCFGAGWLLAVMAAWL